MVLLYFNQSEMKGLIMIDFKGTQKSIFEKLVPYVRFSDLDLENEDSIFAEYLDFDDEDMYYNIDLCKAYLVQEYVEAFGSANHRGIKIEEVTDITFDKVVMIRFINGDKVRDVPVSEVEVKGDFEVQSASTIDTKASSHDIAQKALDECDVVYVYGSLRNGLHNHGYLNGSFSSSFGAKPTFLGTRKVKGFDLYPISASSPSYPFAVPSDGEIIVEAYKVSDIGDMINLDRLEGYPSFYDRKVVEDSEGNKGWVYFIDPTRSEGNMNTFNSVKKYKVHNGDWKQFKLNILIAQKKNIEEQIKKLMD
jgi:gamma-glutamylcyclotransferase (GGCT)/AIG2-like uncharacterized protein YtfP